MILMINDRFYNEQEIRQLIQSQAEQIRQLKKRKLRKGTSSAAGKVRIIMSRLRISGARNGSTYGFRHNLSCIDMMKKED